MHCNRISGSFFQVLLQSGFRARISRDGALRSRGWIRGRLGGGRGRCLSRRGIGIG